MQYSTICIWVVLGAEWALSIANYVLSAKLKSLVTRISYDHCSRSELDIASSITLRIIIGYYLFLSIILGIRA